MIHYRVYHMFVLNTAKTHQPTTLWENCMSVYILLRRFVKIATNVCGVQSSCGVQSTFQSKSYTMLCESSIVCVFSKSICMHTIYFILHAERVVKYI